MRGDQGSLGQLCAGACVKLSACKAGCASSWSSAAAARGSHLLAPATRASRTEGHKGKFQITVAGTTGDL